MTIQGTQEPVTWNLGNMVVVQNLGNNILIGDPGKQDNKIITIPHSKSIEMISDLGNKIVLPYAPKIIPQIKGHDTCRAVKDETIYANQFIDVKLPADFQSGEYVAISSRKETARPWVTGRIVPVNKNGSITIKNESGHDARVAKGEHFADVRSCSKVYIQDLMRGTM